MHPDPAFRWDDRDEMLGFVRDDGFCTIFVERPDAAGPAVIHAPVLVAEHDRLRFHVSRSNRAASRMEGGRALLSCLGPHGYVSPDFYGTPDQVPTWNYVAVEAEGPLRRLDRAELVGLLDALGAEQEAKLAPKPAWTRAKMDGARFERMVEAILGYELTIEALRGTRKLGQNKLEQERLGVVAAIEPTQPLLAQLMAPR